MKLTMVDRDDALTTELRELLYRRLIFSLSRFSPKIRHTTAVFEDVNGPKGGQDKACRIIVKLKHESDVVILNRDSDLARCIARAAERVGRAVARTIDRSKPR